MARNEEKAQSMLNRYLQTQKRTERRPYLATLCDDLSEAKKWHRQVIGDVRRRVAEIHNDSLDEARVRELNDGINKLLRERRHWERRIVVLGGPNYEASRKRRQEKEEWSEDVFEHNGYFYFGAARNLTGVKEVMERQREERKEALRREREENKEVLHKRVDRRYYGYEDEGNAALEREEREAEEKWMKQMVQEWELTSARAEDAEWDTSYQEYIGKKPPTNAEELLQGVVLERRKAEALEQLESDVMQ